MLQLLKIEWLKMKNYSTFKAIAIIFLVCVFGVSYIGYTINSNMSHTPAAMLLGGYFSFPNVWHTVSWLSNWTLFLPGLLMILLVTNEFTYKTHRQNILDGWSREDFIHVKIVTVFIFSLIATFWVFIVALTIGLISGGPFLLDKLEYVGFFFIQTVSILMLALLIATIVKRAGLAIAIFIAYVYIIENVIGLVITGFQIKMNGGVTNITSFGDMLPINATDSLVPFPFFRAILNHGIPLLSVYVLLGLSVIYLSAYIHFTRKLFISKDI